MADTAYGAAPMLNWLVEEKGIAPHPQEEVSLSPTVDQFGALTNPINAERHLEFPDKGKSRQRLVFGINFTSQSM